jgi:hypothetical protein
MRKLSQAIDANNHPVPFASIVPDYVDARVLAANTAESHTIPAGAKFVRLTGSVAFYARFGDTAAIPSADITNGTSPILVSPNCCPATYRIPEGVTTIGVIASAICVITLEFFE